MKDFVIKELTLSNFKGQTRAFSPNERLTKVCGANGIGKTTLYKAFCWLMCGFTDAINVKNHELYDNTKELTHETPESKVRATILVDGVEYAIERRAKAKFSRKRGSNEYTKDSSDSYTILIDDIETSVTDFSSWVERNLGNADLLVYMLIGERFANLTIDDKNKARKILEQVTGEITISDMTGDYQEIKKDLTKYPIEELVERFKNQLKPLKKRIDIIDSLVDVKREEVEHINKDNFDNLSTRIQETLNEISKIDECIANSTKAKEEVIRKYDSANDKLRALSLDLTNAELDYEQKCHAELFEIQKQIEKAKADNQRIFIENKLLTDEYTRLDNENNNLQSKLSMLLDRRDFLVNERSEVKSMVFNDDKCPYCGQDLPFDEIENLKEQFNKNKKAKLEFIVNEGKDLKKQIEEIKSEINVNKARIADLKSKKPQKFVDEDVLRGKYEKAKSGLLPFKLTNIYIDLSKKIQEIKSQIPEIKVDNSELVEQKRLLMDNLEELYLENGKKVIFNGLCDEIRNLQIEKREIGNECAEIEGKLDKCKEYIEERANIISDKINSKLDGCKIVMYSRQKDGELKPDCVIVNNKGIKYSTLNNSARIKLCISIQRMFCKHFGVNMPIFIDEAAVFDSSNLPKYDAQSIYLFASDDTTLKVE